MFTLTWILLLILIPHSCKSLRKPTHSHGKSMTQQNTLRSESDCDSDAYFAEEEEDQINSDDGQSAYRLFEPLQVICEINGFSIPSIIDTGAQISIMSSQCAKRCRIFDDIDKTFSGKAVGVGSSDIIGRVNNLDLRIGPIKFKNPIAVLKDSRVDFLIGLDILSKYDCDINLKEKMLRIRVNNKCYRVPMLPAGSNKPDEYFQRSDNRNYIYKEKHNVHNDLEMGRVLTRNKNLLLDDYNSYDDDVIQSYDDSDEKISLEGV